MTLDRQQQYERFSDAARELFKRGKYRDAIANWEQAREVAAGRPVQEFLVANWIADSYTEMGNYREAIGTLEELVKLKAERGMPVQKDLVDKISRLRSAARPRAGR